MVYDLLACFHYLPLPVLHFLLPLICLFFLAKITEEFFSLVFIRGGEDCSDSASVFVTSRFSLRICSIL